MRVLTGATQWSRKTLESDIFFWKPDKWFKIWFFLVQTANHLDGKHLKRGECLTSFSEIIENTGASRDQVDKMLRWAKQATMIATRKTTRGMVITLLKYDQYQTLDNYKSDTKSDSKSEVKAKRKRHESDTIQENEKNVENVVTVFADEPKPEPLINSKDVAELIDAFVKAGNKTLTFGNVTQRRACEELIGTIGIQKALTRARYAISVRSERYAPVITTPLELLQKMQKLETYYERENKQEGRIAVIS